MALVLAAASCGSSGTGSPTATQTASSSVTPAAGGTITLADDSARLDVPADAVSTTTTITVTTTNATPPAGITAASPILKFEPDGLVFAKPVTVTFKFANATRPIVYWSNSSGGYDAVAGTVSGSTISAQVTHFSSGFVADAPAAATAGGTSCGEGLACSAGVTCGYGASPTASSGGPSSGTGGSSSGTATHDASATDPGSAPKSSALCASGGSTSTGVPMSGGGSSSGSAGPADPGSGGTSTADASASSGSTCSDTGSTGSTGSSGGASMCCSCGSDGKFHCAACGGGTDTGTGGSNDAGVPSGDASAPTNTTCAPGAACTGDQMCGTDGLNGTMCCACAGGHFSCGTTCPGQPMKDAGTTTPPDAGGPTSDCAPGLACAPGAACGNGSSSGTCVKCLCADDGHFQCNPCGSGADDAGAPPPQPDAGSPPPGDDAGAPPPPPATCEAGLACPAGYRCKTADATCTLCTCDDGGHLSCGACPGAPDAGVPASDGGAGPTPIPPQACVQDGACPMPGQPCNNAMPSGNGCLKCTCDDALKLMCASC
ncbi:MAG TPA: hypothetical protein VHJ20_24810 [Polyangia bacterium]|nr:hypothetical protein [Polyangia bacterium]